MKTMNFDEVNLNVDGELITISIDSPINGSSETTLMLEELMIFLTDLGNAMKEAEQTETANKINRELERLKRI